MTPADADPPPPGAVDVKPVSDETWRQVAALQVTPEQRAYVAEPCYYLALCCYGRADWSPLAITAGERVVGFLMWAVDPADGACWLGGILVDAALQGRGIGGAAVKRAIARLAGEHGFERFALSYLPDNVRARRLYARLGFRESGEFEDDEIVARYRVPPEASELAS